MKAKHIITTCGVILGGLAVTGSASAVVTYEGSSDVQFTFTPVLSLSLSGEGFVITDPEPGATSLTPGIEGISNAVVANIASNSSAGYILNASVGNSTYNTTDLTAANGRFAMIGSGTTALTSGTWGYTLDNGATYGALALYSGVPTTIAESSNPTGSVTMKLGAYAASDQLPGAYNNVVNFAVVSKVAARTVTTMAGTNVVSVALGGGGATGSFNEGDTVAITGVCETGKSFVGWSKSADFGTIANPAASSTNYTVGGGDVVLTAYCSE